MRKNFCVRLYKIGKFYCAYGDDGLVLHKLMGYKFVQHKQSAGFPESAFIKVKGKLEDEKISYKVYEKDVLMEEYKGIQKKYTEALKGALESSKVEARIERLKDIIDNLSVTELEKILEVIENAGYKE